ncbi:MAG TPA: hypothetical protein VKW06_21940 [Candidatus Angelobacter sp.]|nr:hypothetical protein [Candidatus Angelobacter sp.]
MALPSVSINLPQRRTPTVTIFCLASGLHYEKPRVIAAGMDFHEGCGEALTKNLIASTFLAGANPYAKKGDDNVKEINRKGAKCGKRVLKTTACR